MYCACSDLVEPPSFLWGFGAGPFSTRSAGAPVHGEDVNEVGFMTACGVSIDDASCELGCTSRGVE